ncbi:MAG: dihydroorotate dehydrogenase electron transfer subunit [Chloroflexi bacterium ADurb.Bin360]|nr:MAG: dihydroorotate dehydrogenase electron transfer subunit [Chloroflexi bacterium ADurb.Bin360]
MGYAGTLETCHGADSPLLEAVQWADRICASCDSAFYPKLARIVRQQRLNPPANFAQALIQIAMPCGVGACEVCRVQTVNGERRACTDGPVFDVLDFGL